MNDYLLCFFNELSVEELYKCGDQKKNDKTNDANPDI